ncbi:hypothetical protein TNCV_1698751 [Trichonephila clavipes]|nr:hypothetical protein TNCV_1698751 [Trichonephila clavipes]
MAHEISWTETVPAVLLGLRAAVKLDINASRVVIVIPLSNYTFECNKDVKSALTRMKLILLILGVLTLSKVIICKANAPMIVSGEKEKKHSTNIGYQGKETLSSKDLKDVYDMAKNISHSKGSIVKVLYLYS